MHACEQPCVRMGLNRTLNSRLILSLPFGIWLVTNSLILTYSNFIKRRQTALSVSDAATNVLLLPEPLPWQPLLQDTTRNLDTSQKPPDPQNRCHHVYTFWHMHFFHKRIFWALGKVIASYSTRNSL